MIAHIFGEIVDMNLTSVVVDVNGVGYEVHAPTSVLEQVSIGSKQKFFTHFSVRETSQDLYGFTTIDAKKLFELLLSVSGVGPKVALSITSLGAPTDIKSAIANSDVSFIVTANGVGKRGAEKIIVDLKDKVGLVGDAGYSLSPAQNSDDALEALISLGYSGAQASQVLSGIDATKSVEARIRLALAEMSKA